MRVCVQDGWEIVRSTTTTSEYSVFPTTAIVVIRTDIITIIANQAFLCFRITNMFGMRRLQDESNRCPTSRDRELFSELASMNIVLRLLHAC